METNWYNELMGCYAGYDECVEAVKNNDEKFFSYIESAPPEYQLPLSEFLEVALLQMQPVLTESAFNYKHSRALSLYRNISKEHSIESKI